MTITPEALARLDKLKSYLDTTAARGFTAVIDGSEAGPIASAIEAALAELSALRAELARVAPLVEAAREYGKECTGERLGGEEYFLAKQRLVGAARTFASQDEAG